MKTVKDRLTKDTFVRWGSLCWYLIGIGVIAFGIMYGTGRLYDYSQRVDTAKHALIKTQAKLTACEEILAESYDR